MITEYYQKPMDIELFGPNKESELWELASTNKTPSQGRTCPGLGRGKSNLNPPNLYDTYTHLHECTCTYVAVLKLGSSVGDEVEVVSQCLVKHLQVPITYIHTSIHA